MELKIISDYPTFANIKDEWNQLLEKTTVDELYLSHEWLCHWWLNYCKNSQLMMLLIYENDSFIAAAPLKSTTGYLHGLPVKKITFIGDSRWTTNALLITTKHPEVVQIIFDYIIQQSWNILDLTNFINKDLNLIKHLELYCKNNHLKTYFYRQSYFPYLENHNISWENFYKKITKKTKKTIRHTINKITNKGLVQIKNFNHNNDLSEILNIIFSISQKSWKHKINNSATSSIENQSFYTSLIQNQHTHLFPSIWILEFNNIPIAYEFHVKYKNKTYTLLADYDHKYRELSPGTVLDYHIMRSTFNYPNQFYDLGCGINFHKNKWNPNHLIYFSYYIFNQSWYDRFLMFYEIKIKSFLKTFNHSLFFNQKNNTLKKHV